MAVIGSRVYPGLTLKPGKRQASLGWSTGTWGEKLAGVVGELFLKGGQMLNAEAMDGPREKARPPNFCPVEARRQLPKAPPLSPSCCHAFLCLQRRNRCSVMELVALPGLGVRWVCRCKLSLPVRTAPVSWRTVDVRAQMQLSAADKTAGLGG